MMNKEVLLEKISYEELMQTILSIRRMTPLNVSFQHYKICSHGAQMLLYTDCFHNVIYWNQRSN